MKLWGTLALIGALMVASVSTAAANADTFTLWENFPMSANGENSFYTAAHYLEPRNASSVEQYIGLLFQQC